MLLYVVPHTCIAISIVQVFEKTTCTCTCICKLPYMYSTMLFFVHVHCIIMYSHFGRVLSMSNLFSLKKAPRLYFTVLSKGATCTCGGIGFEKGNTMFVRMYIHVCVCPETAQHHGVLILCFSWDVSVEI